MSFSTAFVRFCWLIDSSIFYRLHVLCLYIEKKTGYVDSSVLAFALLILICVGHARETGDLLFSILLFGMFGVVTYGKQISHEELKNKGVTLEQYIVYWYMPGFKAMGRRLIQSSAWIILSYLSGSVSLSFLGIIMYLWICYPLSPDSQKKDEKDNRIKLKEVFEF